MFERYVLDLMQKHRSRGLVVDTNLLLVYLVGLCDPSLIGNFKRTQQFDRDDFHIMQAFLGKFARIISTPGIVTEVNSLANQLAIAHKPRFFGVFKSQLAILDEKYVPSRQASEHVYFGKSGLTDSAIMTIASEGLLVLTDDFKLTGYLDLLHIDYLNFNHIRRI